MRVCNRLARSITRETASSGSDSATNRLHGPHQRRFEIIHIVLSLDVGSSLFPSVQDGNWDMRRWRALYSAAETASGEILRLDATSSRESCSKYVNVNIAVCWSGRRPTAA